LVLLIYVWLFGIQNVIALEARYGLRNVPVATTTPIPLSDHTVTNSKGAELRYFGYKFEVPWEDLDTSGIKVGKVKAVLPFQSGVLIAFLSTTNHEFIDGISENLRMSPVELRNMYGSQAMLTDYDFYRLLLYATPKAVRPFDSRKESIAGSTLMIIKALAVPEDSGMYEISAGEFRGFQYGNPGKHPRRIVVDLYSSTRGVEFVFLRPDRKPLSISQSEINRVIQSLHTADSGAKV
jgi:hypothetical protein